MCRQRRDLNTNHENKGNALHSRNQTSDVLFLFRYSRTFRMKISARICMWLAGGKKGSICMLRHASRTNGKRAFALNRDKKKKKKEKEQKREIRMKVYATPSPFPLFLSANLEEFETIKRLINSSIIIILDPMEKRTKINVERRRKSLNIEEICEEFTHDSSRASIFGYMTLLLFRSSNFDIFESTLLGNSQARAAVIPIITSFSFA